MENFIGSNLRLIRNKRGWTMDDLADELARQTGYVYTSNAIGAWERGERRPTPQTMMALCTVLHCTIYSLYYPDTGDTPIKTIVTDEINSLDERHITTFVYLASKWMGNVEPLIELDRCYAMLPPSYRAKLVEYFLTVFSMAIRSDAISPQLDFDLDIIRSGLDTLKRRYNLNDD